MVQSPSTDRGGTSIWKSVGPSGTTAVAGSGGAGFGPAAPYTTRTSAAVNDPAAIASVKWTMKLLTTWLVGPWGANAATAGGVVSATRVQASAGASSAGSPLTPSPSWSIRL